MTQKPARDIPCINCKNLVLDKITVDNLCITEMLIGASVTLLIN